MAKYIVPIEAWVSIEADSPESAWLQAIGGLSNSIGDSIDLIGEGGVSFGEAELDEEEN